MNACHINNSSIQRFKGGNSSIPTRKIPCTTSGQGNAYVMVLYDFDSNSIKNAVGIKPARKNYQSKDIITNCMRT